MRILLLAAAIAAFFTSGAYASDSALSPGKPAGIKNAQIVRDPRFYIVFGLGLVGAGIAIAATSGHEKIVTSTSTTTTTTSP